MKKYGKVLRGLLNNDSIYFYMTEVSYLKIIKLRAESVGVCHITNVALGFGL